MKRFIFILLVFIGVKGFGQQPVFLDFGSSFYSYDFSNCTYRFVGNIPGTNFTDIAFTPDGKLWGISEGSLYQIDTVNITAALIGQSPGTKGLSLVALNDSVLLDEYQGSLWGISTRTAQSYNIGTIGYIAEGDLSWFGTDLYMTTFNQLIKIVLNADYSAILSVAAVNSVNNPIPLCYGLVTVLLNGTPSLIGVYNNGYNISPVNGTVQLLCSSIGAEGAATLSYPGALPVNLLNFTSTLLNKTVQLQWQTTTEINSSYFLVERSIDGVNFSGIGKVNAAGNSTALKQYSFIDQTPLSARRGVGGEAFYRLKEVDLDGKYTYSKVLSVKMQNESAFNIVQNPVQDVLQIQINASPSQTNHLSIFDLTGRRIKVFNAQNGVQNIDVSFLRAGTYFLQLSTADGVVYNKPFVKR